MGGVVGGGVWEPEGEDQSTDRRDQLECGQVASAFGSERPADDDGAGESDAGDEEVGAECREGQSPNGSRRVSRTDAHCAASFATSATPRSSAWVREAVDLELHLPHPRLARRHEHDEAVGLVGDAEPLRRSGGQGDLGHRVAEGLRGVVDLMYGPLGC